MRIEFPERPRQAVRAGNLKWQRRHIPIVGVADDRTRSPRMAPDLGGGPIRDAGVRTTIGAGYRPTLSWRDGDALKFTRLDGADWAPVALDRDRRPR